MLEAPSHNKDPSTDLPSRTERDTSMQAHNRDRTSPGASPSMPPLVPVSPRNPTQNSGTFDTRLNPPIPARAVGDLNGGFVRLTSLDELHTLGGPRYWLDPLEAPRSWMPPSFATDLTRALFPARGDNQYSYQAEYRVLLPPNPYTTAHPRPAYNISEDILSQYSQSDPYSSTMRPDFPHRSNSEPIQATQAPLPPRPVSPSPLLHKVFRLSCRSCDTFFTNRGMRVSHIGNHDAYCAKLFLLHG